MIFSEGGSTCCSSKSIKAPLRLTFESICNYRVDYVSDHDISPHNIGLTLSCRASTPPFLAPSRISHV